MKGGWGDSYPTPCVYEGKKRMKLIKTLYALKTYLCLLFVFTQVPSRIQSFC